jgi:hypothetical protein
MTATKRKPTYVRCSCCNRTPMLFTWSDGVTGYNPVDFAEWRRMDNGDLLCGECQVWAMREGLRKIYAEWLR